MTSRNESASLDTQLLERRRILSLQKVAKLTSLSADTLKRNHRDKIKRLSARRLGMSIADALAIGGSGEIV
jgi:hypothetical protein